VVDAGSGPKDDRGALRHDADLQHVLTVEHMGVVRRARVRQFRFQRSPFSARVLNHVDYTVDDAVAADRQNREPCDLEAKRSNKKAAGG
jgi:hypothetical protein